jgi:hypothetical protein
MTRKFVFGWKPKQFLSWMALHLRFYSLPPTPLVPPLAFLRGAFVQELVMFL